MRHVTSERLILLVLVVTAAAYFGWPAAPTQNVLPEGEPHASHRQQANALAGETSPYLLQHAHNPVDWHPWGPEALTLARDSDRPIFLSIGYSSCYWCHVMEREVFTNADIAALMNRWFVNIKVDREERPDIDEIYMTATQVITQRGGWPNSVFLTPDLKPFFAGTYFPPEDTHGLPGFPTVLTSISEAWANRREAVETQADQITNVIKRLQEGTASSPNPEDLDESIVAFAYSSLNERFDADHGGFGQSPKFPPDTSLGLLLTYYQTSGQVHALRMVTQTLRAMAFGGIHDHLGGGFHRYATDEAWQIPHFEKMLYNQALLAGVYARAFSATGDSLFAETVDRTLEFVAREMTGEHGGFYSALDAETNTIEGLSYLWHASDIRDVLGPRTEGFLKQYALKNMPEESLGAVIQRRDNSPEADLHAARQMLLGRRSERDQPRLDDKVIAGWNGLMIAGLADAYEAMGKEAYLEAALSCWEHLRERQSTEDGKLFRIYRDGVAKGEAYQEDYAFVIRGLLSLYNVTDEETMLGEALRLQALQDELFWDESGSAYFFTSGNEPLLVRQKDTRDSAIPSGNAEAVHNLITLSTLTGNPSYRSRAGRILSHYAGQMKANPASHNRMIHAVARYFGNAPVAATASEGVVSAGATIRHTQNGQILLVELIIKPGWHINANPASDPSLIPTEIVFPSDQDLKIVYPEPETLATAFADETISVYSGRVRLSVDLSPLGPEPVDSIILRYQACDATRCLLPSDVTLVPTTIPEP